MIDINKLQRQVDEKLKSETKFSLLFWLYKKRIKQWFKNNF